MIHISVEEVLYIHHRSLNRFGGFAGVRDLGLLIAAVERPKTTFDGEDMYANLFEKAGALMHSLILNHPFVDGNKRVGFTATAWFLWVNGYRFVITNQEAYLQTIRIAEGVVEMEEIANWLESILVERALEE